MERTILHIDMNNFYASVECMLNPELRRYPVAVCGDEEERHGIVLAKNYTAKAYGVSTGEAIWQAKEKCRNLVIVHPHYDEYMKYSRLAREIYGRYTDLIEPYGMDEVWADMTASLKYFGSGEKLADEIRNTIKSELGLTVSVGVSFNKIFAKLGSDLKKPDAVTAIKSDSFRDIVWPLPASDLLGVGRATDKLLRRYGITTIGGIAVRPVSFFEYKMGKRGIDLWNAANGRNDSPVTVRDIEAPDKSVGHGITALSDLESSEEVWKFMLELSQEIGHRLTVFGKKARGISICIRDNGLFIREWQTKLTQPTQSPSYIAREAFALFLRSYRWENPIRSLTVRAFDLASADEEYQLDLFDDIELRARRESVDRSIEEIRRRFGNNAIRQAVLLKNDKFPPKDNPDVIMPSGLPAS